MHTPNTVKFYPVAIYIMRTSLIPSLAVLSLGMYGSKFCLLSGISKGPQFWDDEVNWLIRKLRGKSFPSVIRRLAWAAIIFYVWHERFVESSKVSKDLLILIFKKANLMWGLRALSSLMLSHVLLSLPYVILGKLVLVFPLVFLDQFPNSFVHW